MMLFLSRKTNQRKQRLKDMQDSALLIRNDIDKKFKDTKIVEQQLADVIEETKKLTTSIQNKLSSRLKITRSTLNSVCKNLKDGVVIVDHLGKVLETNLSFEKSFLMKKDDVIGSDFKVMCKKLHAVKKDGEHFEIKQTFEEMSKLVIDRIKDGSGSMIMQPETALEVHLSDDEAFKCTMTITTLDNDPVCIEDVSFILFFNCWRS